MENNNEKRLIKAYQAIENDKKRRDEIKKEVYEVGYKKPPVSGQFKKGTSGNPRGRKKKVLPKTILEALKLAFIKEISVTNENGKREKIPLIQAFAQRIVQDAIKNDGPSRKMLLQNLQFMNFDFLNMLEEKALEDFEPEATEEDQAFCRESLLKILENYYKNNPDNP